MTEVVPVRGEPDEPQGESLFEQYNLRLVDLGGGPVFLTPEGQSIFAGHLRMQRAQQLAGLLGYLIQERMQQGPITEPISVIDVTTAPDGNPDDDYVLGQAVWRTPSYLGREDIDFFRLERHEILDEDGYREETVTEAALSEDAYVRTHTGRQHYRVVLSPTPMFETK